jgi:hypothetical protein
MAKTLKVSFCMGKFTDLHRRATEIGVDSSHDYAMTEFPNVVRQSNLDLWNLGDFVKSKGIRYLLGVVTWSLYDLRLLDALDEVFSQPSRDEKIDVLNLDLCKSQNEIQFYIPDIGNVLHPPVVGVWQDGKQIKQASGYYGRMILVEAFSLNHDQLIRPGKYTVVYTKPRNS